MDSPFVALVPLWWAWPHPGVLLVAQAGLVAASIVPVWRFAARRMPATPALCVAAAYALAWPLQGLVDYDFHEVAFAVPLIAWLLVFFDERRSGPLLACAGALLLVREDMFVVLLAFAALGFTQRRWRIGSALVGLAVAGYAVAMVVVIPWLSPTGNYGYWSLGQFGPDPVSVISAIATDPVRAATTLVVPDTKVVTLMLLLAPFAFVSLTSPYVLLAVPLLMQRFLSEREAFWGTEFHYSAPLAPILACAAVDGLTRIARRLPDRWQSWAPRILASWAVGFAVVGTALSPGLYPFHRLATGEAFVLAPGLRTPVQSLPRCRQGHV